MKQYLTQYLTPTRGELAAAEYVSREHPLARVLHLGTGAHHHLVQNTKARVTGVTNCRHDVDAYIDLCTRLPMIMDRYRLIVSDYYRMSTPEFAPFEVVTMLHLCEYSEDPSDDVALFKSVVNDVAPGSAVLGYPKSFGWSWAKTLFMQDRRMRFVFSSDDLVVLKKMGE